MVDLMHSSPTLQMVVPATLGNIDKADAGLCAFLDGVDNIDRFAARILLREAMLNAVVHGCGQDPARNVELDAELSDTGLTLRVRDEGRGFAWQKLHDHMDILAESGRGIPLMRIYASQVVFNEAGNEVTLHRAYEASARPQGATL